MQNICECSMTVFTLLSSLCYSKSLLMYLMAVIIAGYFNSTQMDARISSLFGRTLDGSSSRCDISLQGFACVQNKHLTFSTGRFLFLDLQSRPSIALAWDSSYTLMLVCTAYMVSVVNHGVGAQRLQNLLEKRLLANLPKHKQALSTSCACNSIMSEPLHLISSPSLQPCFFFGGGWFLQE